MAKKISLNDKANRKTGTDADEIILAKGGNDFVDGAGGNDSLDGGSGNDKLRGGAGDDAINGGSGRDTAIFSGPLEDEDGNLLYSAEFDESGRKLIVTDLDGEDGTDSLQGIEFLQFADRTVSLDDFVALMEAGEDGAVAVDIDNVVALKEGSSGGTTPYTFNLRLSHASAQPVVVHVASQEGTASSGEDFQPIDQDIEFLPGDLEQSVTVLVAADKIKEGDEEFRLVLSDAEGAEILGDGTGMGRILNDDAKTTGQVGISIADLQIKEGDGGTQSATLTVGLSGSSSKTITVAYASVAGSASGDDDFQPKGGTLTFKPGDTQKTIVIPINGDTQPEGDETFTVTLSNPKNAQLLRSTATVTIQEDDSAVQPTPNQNPQARDDSFTGLPAGQQVIKTGADLTANDVDPDADPISVTGVSGASGGMVSLNAQGQIVFTPDTGTTRGSYLYTVTDGKGGTGQASVSLEFAAPPQNHSPVAQNDSFTGLPANQPVTKTAADLTANDSDPDGDPLTITAVANATGGTVALNNGQIVFTPATNATAGGFGYTVSDGKGGTASATVQLGFASASPPPTTPTSLPPDTRSYDLTLPLDDKANSLDGSALNEKILGLGGGDKLDGKAGNDHLDGGEGDDRLTGDKGDDYLLGGVGDDIIEAGEGNDSIDGGSGNDQLSDYGGLSSVIYGGAGDDYVQASVSSEDLSLASFLIVGGNGNDSLSIYGDGRADQTGQIDGGDGDDSISVSSFAHSEHIFVHGGNGDDTISVSEQKYVYGDAGNDTLQGYDGELHGGAGDDTLLGNGLLLGDEGKDTLRAGSADTILYGGLGADTLVTEGYSCMVRYAAAGDSGVGLGNRDVIADFDTASNALIDLGRLASGALSFIIAAPFSGKAGEVRYDIDVPNNRTVVGIDLNGDKGVDVEIELVGVKILSADDFFLAQPT